MGSGNTCDHSLRHGYQTQLLIYQEDTLLVNKYFTDTYIIILHLFYINFRKALAYFKFVLPKACAEWKQITSLPCHLSYWKSTGLGARQSFLTKGHGFSGSQCPVHGTTYFPQRLQAHAPPLSIDTWTMQKRFSSKRLLFIMEWTTNKEVKHLILVLQSLSSLCEQY